MIFLLAGVLFLTPLLANSQNFSKHELTETLCAPIQQDEVQTAKLFNLNNQQIACRNYVQTALRDYSGLISISSSASIGQSLCQNLNQRGMLAFLRRAHCADLMLLRSTRLLGLYDQFYETEVEHTTDKVFHNRKFSGNALQKLSELAKGASTTIHARKN